MKKLFIVIVLAFVSMGAFAQSLKTEVGIGASRFRGDADGDYRFAWSIGAGYEFLISGPFSIQPQLNIIKKGSKLEDGLFSAKASAYYFEVPVMASYRFYIPELKINVVPQAGAYLGYGFAGRTRSTLNSELGKVKDKYDTFSNSNLREQDYGVALRVDVEWQDYVFGLRWGLGLKDINKVKDGGSVKNNTIMLTAGLRW